MWHLITFATANSMGTFEMRPRVSPSFVSVASRVVNCTGMSCTAGEMCLQIVQQCEGFHAVLLCAVIKLLQAHIQNWRMTSTMHVIANRILTSRYFLIFKPYRHFFGDDNKHTMFLILHISSYCTVLKKMLFRRNFKEVSLGVPSIWPPKLRPNESFPFPRNRSIDTLFHFQNLFNLFAKYLWYW